MKQIKLTNSPLFALVDDEDYNVINQREWYVSIMGKPYICSGHSGIRLHHLVLNIIQEQLDKGIEIHHKDDNGFNNQKENLVPLTRSLHLMTRGKQSNNTSGFKGVSWKRKGGNRGKWIAQIGVRRVGNKNHIGYFKTPEEAAMAYDREAIKRFGDNAKLNFPYARTQSVS